MSIRPYDPIEIDFTQTDEPEFFIVQTADGNFHKIDVESGTVEWKTETQIPLLTSSNYSSHKFILPSVSGLLYLFDNQTRTFERLPVTIKELFEYSPFKSDDGVLYMSSKNSYIYEVEIDTGEVISRNDRESSLQTHFMPNQLTPSSDKDFEDDDVVGHNKVEKRKKNIERFIRIDYFISGYDGRDGSLKFNVSFSDVFPFNYKYSFVYFSTLKNQFIFSTSDKMLCIQMINKILSFSFDSQPINIFIKENQKNENSFGSKYIKLIPPIIVYDESNYGFNEHISEEEEELIYVTQVQASNKSFESMYAIEVRDSGVRRNVRTNLLRSSSESELEIGNNDIQHQGRSTAIVEYVRNNDMDDSPEMTSKFFGIQNLKPFSQYKFCLNSKIILEKQLKNSLSNNQKYLTSNNDDDLYINSDIISDGELPLHDPSKSINIFESYNSEGIDNDERRYLIIDFSMINYVTLVVIVILTGIILVLLVYIIWNIRKKKIEKKIEENDKEKEKEKEKEVKVEEYKYKINSKGELIIDNLVIRTREVIGTGSNGTIVFTGMFEKRKVAIKRILKQFYDIANREISLLIDSDYHNNIVRYYCKKEDNQFVYLALEFCPQSLSDLFSKSNDDKYVSYETKVEIIKGLGLAIRHLHAMNIVHRDLKPGNVLIQHTKNTKQELKMVTKLTDMGLCKRINKEKSSYHNTTGNKEGTFGWQAPELLLENSGRKTKKVDIFAFGCIIFYVITNGKHLFGRSFERERNIIGGNYSDNINILKNIPDLKNLIIKCVNKNYKERPSINEILKHPFFWNINKRLEFIADFSDQCGLYFRNNGVEHRVLKTLQRKKRRFFNYEWKDFVDKEILKEISRYRKYDYKRVWDLIRCVRNILSHYREYSKRMQDLLNPYPVGIYKYFFTSKRFKFLFSEIYYLVKEDNWMNKYDVFDKFF